MSTTVDLITPSICVYPEAATSAAQDVIDVARLAGLHLDQWQCFCLERALGERPDGRWAAFEVGTEVGRQNGKGGILEARELGGLFALDDRLLVHSAHEFATSREHQGRIEFLIQNTPELNRHVRAYKHAHGEEGIYLRSGRRLLFRTRTKGGGRGFSADFVAFDEAMILPEATVGALLPTLSARPNPQVWYAGSAVDKEIHLDGVVFARLRERALAGDSSSLAYFGWEFRPDGWEGPFGPDDVTAEMAADPASWAMANPALGIRISPEHVAKERRSMAPRTFAVERLGVGDWPETDPDAGAVIDVELWRDLADGRSTMIDPVTFAFDVSPDRAWAAIAAVGASPDGHVHAEVVDHRRGTGWVAGRLEELRQRWRPAAVVYDERSQAASLANEIQADALSTSDYVRACGAFFDLVEQRMIRHLGTPELESAIRGAAKRNLGDAWAWSRRSSSVDISPLVAVTLAAHSATTRQTSPFFIS